MSDNTPSYEALAGDIAKRMEAVGKAVEPAAIRQLINESLSDLAKDPEFTRKMRFASGDAKDEKLKGSKFDRWDLNARDVEFFFDLMNAQRASGRGTGPSEQLTQAFKEVSDAFYMSEDEVRKIDEKAIDNVFSRQPIRNFYGKDRILAARGAYQETSAFKRAMDTVTSGEGQEFVGAGYVQDLWTVGRAQSRVFGQIPAYEMRNPTEYLPFESDVPEMQFYPENTASSTTEYTTVETGSRRAQVDAKKFLIHQIWSGEMEEDSIIQFVPFLRKQAESSLAVYSDSLVINGDTVTAGTGNINSVTSAPATNKHYLAFDGIKKAALVDGGASTSVSAAGALTYDKIHDLRTLMIDAVRFVNWGRPSNPADLLFITDPATADKVAKLTELKTAVNYLDNATVLKGQIGSIGRNPLLDVISMGLANTAGKVDLVTPANNTTGTIIAFNVNGVKVGWRRRVKLATEVLPGRDQTRLVYSLRCGMARYTPTGAMSAQRWATALYNI